MPTYMLIVCINSLKPVGDMQHNKIAYNKQLVKEVCLTSLLFSPTCQHTPLQYISEAPGLQRRWWRLGKVLQNPGCQASGFLNCLFLKPECRQQPAQTQNPPTDITICAQIEREHGDDLL